MKILALANINSGVAYHRIVMPLVYMMQGKPDDYLKITNQITEETLEQGWDILALNRTVAFSTNNIEEWRKKYGFKLIVDNDDYWHLDPHHVLYEYYDRSNISKQIIDYMKIADVVTVTHSRLADEAYKINKNVHILPNALPYGDGQFNDAKMQDDKVRLFWSGSDTHAQDLTMLRNPMQRIFGDCDLRSKVKIVMAGYAERSKPVWDVMVSAFTSALRFDSTIYQFTQPDKYMGSYCDSDISIIPLLSTPFNGFKSNLKVLETAAKHNPVVVSQTDPYLDMPVCYARTQQYWYKWVKELVNDEAMRIEKGEELFQFCNKHYNLKTINKKRYAVYIGKNTG